MIILRAAPVPCWSAVGLKHGALVADRNGTPKEEAEVREITFEAGKRRAYRILNATRVGMKHERQFSTYFPSVNVMAFAINIAKYDTLFEGQSTAQLKDDLALCATVCERGPDQGHSPDPLGRRLGGLLEQGRFARFGEVCFRSFCSTYIREPTTFA
jgi:hypothetical protein